MSEPIFLIRSSGFGEQSTKRQLGHDAEGAAGAAWFPGHFEQHPAGDSASHALGTSPHSHRAGTVLQPELADQSGDLEAFGRRRPSGGRR